MNDFSLPFGLKAQSVQIPEKYPVDLILPPPVAPAHDPYSTVADFLDHPLDFDFDHFRGAQSVAIAVNDKTRPVPHELLLHPLLARLESLGIQPSSIRIYVATGSHHPMTPAEIARLLPEDILARYAACSHDIDDQDNLVYLGETQRQTPIWVNRQYYQSDLKIVAGDIEPHHFAGFSGGVKSAAIGMAGRPTINHNHAMLVDPNAWIGIYQQNPLRQDIEEIGSRMQIHLAVNTLLNQEKQVVAAFSGHPLAVMQAGIPVARQICGTSTTTLYDLVIASAGGNPKDINFYQAQKALTHASLFCKEGGTIILAAACPEGIGSQPYDDFMQGVSSVAGVFEKFKRHEFRVGPS